MLFARTLYQDTPLVILDEPTAALDPESECEVYAGFDTMVGRKTAIYISHRLASCRFCQDIWFLTAGRWCREDAMRNWRARRGCIRNSGTPRRSTTPDLRRHFSGYIHPV